MKFIVALVSLTALALGGCYTIVNPPPEFYATPTAKMAAPDSISSDGVTIFNQNTLILDGYYRSPWYYREGYFRDGYYWDPYYYNPGGWYRPHRWWRGRYHDNDDYYGGSTSPEIPTPRREYDPRQAAGSGYPPTQLPGNGTPDYSGGEKRVVISPSTPDPSSGDSSKSAERQLRSTDPEKQQEPAKPAPKPAEEKKSRREKGRDR